MDCCLTTKGGLLSSDFLSLDETPFEEGTAAPLLFTAFFVSLECLLWCFLRETLRGGGGDLPDDLRFSEAEEEF